MANDWWKNAPLASELDNPEEDKWWETAPIDDAPAETPAPSDLGMRRGQRQTEADVRLADAGGAVPDPETAPAIDETDDDRADRRDPDDPFEGESFGDLTKRRGKQFARGATEVVASVPESLAIAGAGNPNEAALVASEIVQRSQEQIELAQERLRDNPDLDDETRQRIENVISEERRTIRAYQELVDQAEGPLKPAAKDRPLFQQGEKIREASRETFGEPDARDTSFWAGVAEGAGNLTALAAASIVTGPVGLGTGAGLGASMNTSQIYREAIDAGADEETAKAAARWGAAIGTTEIIPISRALKLLPPRLRGNISNRMMKRFADIAQGAGEEAAQEYLATVANNLVAQGYYDPERGWNEGATEAALIGAVLGGGMGAVGTAARGDRETPASRPPPSTDRDRPDSPRLTPEDRQSPIPNDLIDDGKAIIERATGIGRPETSNPRPPQDGVPPLAREARPQTPQTDPPQTGRVSPTRPEQPDVPEGAVPIDTLYDRPVESDPEVPSGDQTTSAPSDEAIEPAKKTQPDQETDDQARQEPEPQNDETETASTVEEVDAAPARPAAPAPGGMEILANEDLTSPATDTEVSEEGPNVRGDIESPTVEAPKSEVVSAVLPAINGSEVSKIPSRGLVMRVGGKNYPIKSLEDASQRHQKTVEAGDFGNSEVPNPHIYKNGEIVGYVAYNGRVFPGRAEDWTPELDPLYEPSSQQSTDPIEDGQVQDNAAPRINPQDNLLSDQEQKTDPDRTGLSEARDEGIERADEEVAPGEESEVEQDGETRKEQRQTNSLSAKAIDTGAIDRMIPDLRARLDRMALGRVQLGMAPSDADFQAAIDLQRTGEMKILIGSTLDPDRSVDHEAVHALRAMNLFTDPEWAALTTEAERVWMKRYDISGRYGDLTQEQQIEEAIAEAFADRVGKSKGMIANAFAKLRRFFKALSEALGAQKITSVDQLFQDIEEGVVGSRESDTSVDQERRFALPDSMKSLIRRSLRGDEQNRPFILGDIPDVMTDLGAKGQKVVVSESVIWKAVDKHGISEGDLIATLEGLQTPIAIFESATSNDSFVSLMDATSRGRPIVVAIEHSFQSGKMTLARVKSIHAKDNPKTIGYWMDEGLVRFFDKKAADAWSIAHGLQLPKAFPRHRHGKKILTPKDVIKSGTQRKFQRPDASKSQMATNGRISKAIGEPLSHSVSINTSAESRKESFLKAFASQPIDQIFRIPFAVVGGLDSAGRWRVGKAAEERIRGVVIDKKFSETGSLRFINPLLERARHGLIDRHGLPQEYIERERRRAVDESIIAAEGKEHLVAISNAGMNASESRVLQAVLTGEAVPDGEMNKISEPIRKAIDDLGAEAVNIGLISAESYQRNRGTYLHRVYEKDEIDKPGPARWAENFLSGRRQKIIGNQFKGRGLFEMVETDRIFRESPDFQSAKRGKPIKGDKIIILDLMSDAGMKTLDGIDRPKGRVKRRIFWPESEPIPKSLGDYKNRGVFELRGFKGEKAVLWRDFTKEERLRMGEILDARYTVAKTYSLMAHDLATGRFFKDIAQNDEWARKEPPEGAVVDPDPQDKELRKRLWVDPTIEWVKVPSSKIGKSETFRYGALAGKYLRADIWRDMEELRALQTPGTWRRITTQWKLNKTARSPVVHMNNVMSNFVLMDMADVRIPDLVAGIREMHSQGEFYQEALQNGAFGADQVTQEFRQNVLDPLLRDIADESRGKRSSFAGEIGQLGRILDGLYRYAKRADEKMVSIYQLEDQVFRMATYMRRRQQGYTVEDASTEARDQFLNYDIRAPWINAARATVLPFIAYTYRAIPKIAQTIAERPWKIAKYVAITQGLNMMAYTVAPSDYDEEEERKSFREGETGKTWVYTDRLLRMPWLSETGDPVFLDIRRWIPAGDVFDLQGDVPSWLQIGGPAVIAAELYLNKQAFTQDEIFNPIIDTASERMIKRANFVYKSWMPSAAWIPNSWYMEKIWRAAKGDARQWHSNEPYSLTEAIFSSFGVKLKPKDIEAGYAGWDIQFKRISEELDAEERSLGRQFDRGLIDDEAYDDGLDRLDEKREILMEAWDLQFSARD